MKLFRFFVLGVICALLLNPPAASAQSKITASITVTNSTTNGVLFTLNGDTRTFTNNVANSATQVGTNSTANGSKTNLLTQIRTTPFAQVRPVDTGSNSFNLVGNSDLAMALTLTAGYATVSYSTQTVVDLIALQGPVSALPTAQARINVASDIVGGINAAENTNAINQNSTAASQLMGTTNSQTISGRKTLNNTNNLIYGILVSLGISGNVVAATNGYYLNPILDSPTTTNLVNHGNAISSPGIGVTSEQFGAVADAEGFDSLAVGYSSLATGTASEAVGYLAQATGDFSLAVGRNAAATAANSIGVGSSAAADGTNSIAIGNGAAASANNATALGTSSSASYTNSTAIGYSAATTAPNQVMLGAPGISTVVNNDMSVLGNVTISGTANITGGVTISGTQTNGAHIGTNNFLANSDIAFVQKSVSSLANGNNAAVPIGTNVVIVVSGPSAAFTINGIANGRDGKLIIIKNKTGQTLTIANQSGTDPTAANRIRTGLSGDYSITNNPGIVTLEYDGADARWDLVSHN